MAYFKIYQLVNGHVDMKISTHGYHTFGLDDFKKFAFKDILNAYVIEMEKVFDGDIDSIKDSNNVNDTLEQLYYVLNNGSKKPEGYSGYSLYISDIICYKNRMYYVDSVGFIDITDDLYKNTYKQLSESRKIRGSKIRLIEN